jgi:DNA-binding transcriptional regulator GbsR (MarR family)
MFKNLNEYEAAQDRADRMLENFRDDIDPYVDEIETLIEKIRSIEKGYEDDFDEEIDEVLTDLVYPTRINDNVRKLIDIRDDLLKIIGRL